MQGWKFNLERDKDYVETQKEIDWWNKNVFLPWLPLHNQVGFRGVLISSLIEFKFDQIDPNETYEVFLEKHVLSAENIVLMMFIGIIFMMITYKNYRWYYKI